LTSINHLPPRALSPFDALASRRSGPESPPNEAEDETMMSKEIRGIAVAVFLVVGASAHAGLGPNGLGPNGLGPNGLGPNGLGPNGLGPNGLGPNGLGPNGLGPNGLVYLITPAGVEFEYDASGVAVGVARDAGGRIAVHEVLRPLRLRRGDRDRLDRLPGEDLGLDGAVRLRDGVAPERRAPTARTVHHPERNAARGGVAHVNLKGTHQYISIRGNPPNPEARAAIATSTNETIFMPMPFGILFADLLAVSPYKAACRL
jgi:hypothetical protein